MCNEQQSKWHLSVPNKHIHNWYNVVLCKNKQVQKGDGFLCYFAISFLIHEHDWALKSLKFLIQKRIDHCKIGFATRIIEDQLVSNVDTLTPQNDRPEITLGKWNSPEFRNIVKICASSSCVEVLCATPWVLAHTSDGIEIAQRKTCHHYMATWIPE